MQPSLYGTSYCPTGIPSCLRCLKSQTWNCARNGRLATLNDMGTIPGFATRVVISRCIPRPIGQWEQYAEASSALKTPERISTEGFQMPSLPDSCPHHAFVKHVRRLVSNHQHQTRGWSRSSPNLPTVHRCTGTRISWTGITQAPRHHGPREVFLVPT